MATDSSPGNYAKRILIIVFRPTATLADRQLAIALVHGVVVGGDQTPDNSVGYYYVKVPDGSGSGVPAAIRVLVTLPHGQVTTFEAYLDELYLRPN